MNTMKHKVKKMTFHLSPFTLFSIYLLKPNKSTIYLLRQCLSYPVQKGNFKGIKKRPFKIFNFNINMEEQ